jgi:hypothetical protein
MPQIDFPTSYGEAEAKFLLVHHLSMVLALFELTDADVETTIKYINDLKDFQGKNEVLNFIRALDKL